MKFPSQLLATALWLSLTGCGETGRAVQNSREIDELKALCELARELPRPANDGLLGALREKAPSLIVSDPINLTSDSNAPGSEVIKGLPLESRQEADDLVIIDTNPRLAATVRIEGSGNCRYQQWYVLYQSGSLTEIDAPEPGLIACRGTDTLEGRIGDAAVFLVDGESEGGS
ncbi:MAG: hypothetical protein KY449_11405, partial [Proteobacteria bacterium]|nr:hypothetical protein [Pseudomonadota bacterium]